MPVKSNHGPVTSVAYCSMPVGQVIVIPSGELDIVAVTGGLIVTVVVAAVEAQPSTVAVTE